jgi:hypothetical protein
VNETPGLIELDDSSGAVRVRLTLPQESFTVPELRSFAAYLNTVADEAEPSPEVQELTQILESAAIIPRSSRAMARVILGAGYSRQQPL